MPDAMDSQQSGPPSDKPLHVATATLLLLAGEIACASETPSWGRERALELIDALLALATQHGFAQPDALRTKLITRTLTERTQLLAEIAFNAVPASALLAAVRQSGFNMAQ
ncbi:hypothetical protein KY49_4593 [Burkholderia sp. MSHR3999]|uniref:Uncharacterized protein n=2 Tax=Burkholderiaceae TaxID=119060 RepID=A0ABD6QB43_9BURK|nr:hypothetical protein KY49_4593 [Burkholderia sp. MSHR3999]OJA51110.1 hypothetical protein BGV66_01495 [Burkholderia ubonensis]